MTTLVTTGRVQVLGVPGDRHEEVLTPEALDFIARLDAAFAARRFDLLTERRRRSALLRGGGLIAGGGLALGVVGGTPVTAIIGFACLGAGLSCVVPLLYSTAGTLDPARPGAALSRVAALGYLGYVLGPAIIGGASMYVGLGNALLILPALAMLLVIAAPVVHRSRGRHHRTSKARSHESLVPAGATT